LVAVFVEPGGTDDFSVVKTLSRLLETGELASANVFVFPVIQPHWYSEGAMSVPQELANELRVVVFAPTPPRRIPSDGKWQDAVDYQHWEVFTPRLTKASYFDVEIEVVKRELEAVLGSANPRPFSVLLNRPRTCGWRVLNFLRRLREAAARPEDDSPTGVSHTLD
jgi:hypothetical protein